MSRIVLILALVCLGQSAFAAQVEEEQQAKGDEPEKIIARESLAVHLGLGPQDVVFAPPRNFRTEQMNQLSLEPLDSADPEDLETN